MKEKGNDTLRQLNEESDVRNSDTSCNIKGSSSCLGVTGTCYCASWKIDCHLWKREKKERKGKRGKGEGIMKGKGRG